MNDRAKSSNATNTTAESIYITKIKQVPICVTILFIGWSSRYATPNTSYNRIMRTHFTHIIQLKSSKITLHW